MTPKIFERIYIELKREVTSGRYMPGQRLQARSLADTLRTSTSPVNQAMRQLIGEQVLEYSEQDGFIVPRVTERRLRDLFQWSAYLASVTPSETQGVHEGIWPSPETDSIATTEALLLALVTSGNNFEISHAMNNANDRLRATRRLEEHLFADRREELRDMVDLWESRNVVGLRAAMTHFHERRLAAVSQLVGLSYQDRR